MSIDLLQRALDYVRFYNPEKDQEIRAKLHKDLKAALAKHDQIHTSVDSNTHQLAQDEPVIEYPDYVPSIGWRMVDPVTGDVGIGTPKQARQPLTDEQIKQIEVSLRQYNTCNTYDLSLNDFARAIEQAHGIGEKK